MASQRSTSPTPVLEQSDPSPTSPSPRRPTVPLMYATATDPTSEPLEEAAVWGSPDPAPSDQPEPSDEPRTSSRGSSGSSVLSKDQLRETVREGVTAAGVAANEHLTRDQLERDGGLYLADEKDAHGIGDPVANLVHRRGWTKVGDPDLRDAIAAAIALGRYLWKQYERWAAIRAVRQEARRAIAEPGTVPAGDDETTTAENR